MNDNQNTLEKEVIEVHYNRSHRRVEPLAASSEAEESQFVEEIQLSPILEVVKLNWPHYITYLLMSALVSLTTVVLPYLDTFANGLQMQHLYTGIAMSQGQMPFSSIFATGGFLYYTIIAVLSHFHLEWALAIVQGLALFISGIYLEKLLIRLTNRNGLGQSFTLLFYFFQLAFGFGGLYPIQWAMPFVLMGLYYLSQYFVGKAKDEIFIAYGVVAAFAILLDPKTLIFWLLALFVLLVYNLSYKRFARGFYHFLALSFGLVLVLYTALYFILNLQILSPMISQTLLYPLMVPGFENNAIWLTIALQLACLLLSGLLTGLFIFYSLIKSESHQKSLYWLLFLATISYAVLTVLSQSFWLYPLLYVLPFGLLLTGIWVVKMQEDLRRPKVVGTYVKRHLFAPLLVILLGIAYPIGMGFMEKAVNQEREVISSYLVEQTADDEAIYAWDKTSRIYQVANRHAASQLISPIFYVTDKANHQLLEDELLQHRGRYLVVNKNLPLSKTLEKDISNHYQKASLKDLTYFDIYELN